MRTRILHNFEMRYATVVAMLSLSTACGARSELSSFTPSIADASASDVVVMTEAGVDAGADSGTLTVLADSNGFALAVDDARVYWTALDIDARIDVLACAKDGCGGTPTVVAAAERFTGDFRAHTLAVNSTNVYWAGGGNDPKTLTQSVMACPKSGCQTASVFVSTGEGLVGIAANDTDVYWTFGGYLPTVDGNVETCPVAGCGGMPTPFAPHQTSGDLALDGNKLVWANLSGIVSCPLVGCTTPTLVSAVPFFPTSIAASSGFATWARQGGVEACASGSCVKATMLATSLKPGPVATDGVNVYWAPASDNGANAILKCSTSGCNGAPQTMTTFQGTVGGIAVDATSIYWTYHHDGDSKSSVAHVMKLTPK